MSDIQPILTAIAFGLASIAFIWFAVQDRVLGGQRMARRLFGATRRAVGSSSST